MGVYETITVSLVGRIPYRDLDVLGFLQLGLEPFVQLVAYFGLIFFFDYRDDGFPRVCSIDVAIGEYRHCAEDLNH